MLEKSSKSSGNALFVILIAVALFAALSYAVSRSGTGNNPSSKNEQIQASISEMFSYIDLLRSAALRMRVDGIAPTDIYNSMFTAPAVSADAYAAGYTCGMPPSFTWDSILPILTGGVKGSMHHPDGYGVSLQLIPLTLGALDLDPCYRSNGSDIKGIGLTGPSSPNADLIVYGQINKQACQKINEKFGIGSAIPSVPDYNIIINPELTGKYEGCFLDSSNNVYMFYAVIMPDIF